MSGTHRCPGPDCRIRSLPERLLACAPHWRQVPERVRSAVYESYDHGRGVGTPEHSEAIRRAVSFMTPLPERRER